jgi:outer membrane protein
MTEISSRISMRQGDEGSHLRTLGVWNVLCIPLLTLALAVSSAAAQQVSAAIDAAQVNPSTTSSYRPITIAEAIKRAQKNEPTFAAAITASKVATLNRSIARSALLPNAVYHNQFLYTQGATASTGSANASAGTASAGSPRFIANNAVHEYTSQGIVSETIGMQQVTAVAVASAQAAVAQAELEITRRGLIATVVALYYGSIAADQKIAVAQRAASEAAAFTTNTRDREVGREVAHADVVRAQLQQQQRDRDLADARLNAEKARLELAVMLFPDPHTAFTLAVPAAQPLPSREDIEAAAANHSAELKSAIASLHAASLDVTGARAAYLPDLALNYTYGIDAPEMAIHAPDGTRNLGYSASATLDIPVWDWFATHNRIKQSISLRESARIALTATQRHLIAQLDEFYSEAKVAQEQLQSLDISVETARESLRLSHLRYTAGEGTVLEVVDAQTSAAAAENAHEDGILRYENAVAALQTLTGELSAPVQTPGPAKTPAQVPAQVPPQVN